MNERDLFMEALDKQTPEERAAFLQEQCGSDLELRRRIEALLDSHQDAGAFLQMPVPERVAPKLTSDVDLTEDGGTTEADHTALLSLLSPTDKPGSLGRLGHYEVLEVVGRGGFGIVLRAFDEKLHRVVAIKAMAPHLAATSPPRKRFLREARAAGGIRHDNIVNIYSVEEQPIPFLVMEFIDGQSLQQRVDSSGPLEVAEVLRLGQQIASGLAAAHELGLVHRDIKPGNILVEDKIDPRAKITDFGLARAADDASLTQTGIIAGTPMYMSPEQASGEPVDHRADLFSLGSVLYLMASGRPPFRGPSSVAVLKRVVEDTPRPIREIMTETPAWLCAVIDRLQEKDPAKRFRSAREVADILSGYLAHVRQPSLPPPLLPEPVALKDRTTPIKRNDQDAALAPAASPSRAPWLVAAALLLLIVFGVLGATEVSGVTRVAATVIRIFTPDGTLVVETNDSDVKVTIEGDGGLVIVGAGAQEVRLSPGSYRVRATKDGKNVPLERELVRISQGNRELVNVRLESVAPVIAAKLESEAFVVLDGKGTEVGKFRTLTAAVQGSSGGDTIEVRGNGPFITNYVDVRKPLTIRAAAGYRPFIKLHPDDIDKHALLQTASSLVLEGLDFERAPPDRGPVNQVIVNVDGSALYVANCRFRMSNVMDCLFANKSAMCTVRNCYFGQNALRVRDTPNAKWLMENCVVAGRPMMLEYSADHLPPVTLRFRRNTVINSDVHLTVGLASKLPTAPDEINPDKPIRVEAVDNLFDVSNVLEFQLHARLLEAGERMEPAEMEAALLRLVEWRDRRNLFAFGSPSITWRIWGAPTWKRGPTNLAEWNKFWDADKVDSLEGQIKFKGGDLLGKLATKAYELNHDDLRLRSDSTGYRAGQDGPSLGTEIALVGPGEAFERWKKTAEYQQWRKDIAN